jgi:hypothetical protein
MKSWGKAFGFGTLVWLLPFLIAFVAFPVRTFARPVFESIMSVAVAVAAVVFGLLYLRHVSSNVIREGSLVGLLWFAVCVVIDAPLMLFGGPMQMSLGEYMGDIGLTYVGIPVVTTGLAVARSWKDTQ